MNETRILGIEGTAWAASAALFDTESDTLHIESDAYEPDSGGIHPREAAEHMAEAIPQVIETVLEHAIETAPEDETVDNRAAIDAIAFARGPGLGPCLRIVATAARALAATLEVPLVGVNHMVAHLEIGRHESGFDDPICLNASGANAHLLAFRNGRYRVLGETMDTGVGNAIDKFTRHIGWSHPGGPKVEQAAKDGEYIDLPYVVKGMDFSFSGIMSAAKDAVDDGHAVEDVCFALQETIFAMLTEVSERALSLTGCDELVLGGGVGRNARLREMLETMCANRGAEFYAPEPRLLGDNAGMIAVLGAKMYDSGDTLSVENSRVDPNFRPDQVPVTWRSPRTLEEESVGIAATTDSTEYTTQGAEAHLTIEPTEGRVRKRRLEKAYRHPELDARLRRDRTTLEARLTSLARRHGVATPVVTDVDRKHATLEFEYVGDCDLRDALTPARVRSVGRSLATIHRAGFVHGDPTTRNVRVGDDRTYLIDFGLGYHTDHVEDYAMDLHIFDQSLVGTAADPEPLRDDLREGYRSVGDQRILERLREIETRGRYVE
ncbi:bifunctional N(6)-L-threonylcarbamoyladenine synthase/serine/threonine protein kinase [Natronosalvus amylolyticus]|uniref:bifunctional N(6)-L-threonylcarbamoyladenine synthase/serine/threonine protein kinase n=1 Tax=Natronosalvus amylolyticus TaxID=2961994 RepID=UPI0020CA1121|nr:bifunctional N(6)-L-threonylcarbamoyladenine synthase/serine/threonine protein kinase [Natronosalvus amylolyticus]